MIYKPTCKTEFVEILRKNQNTHILLVFFSNTCHVCEQIEEYLQTMPNQMVIKLDVNIFTDLAESNNISRVPTSLLILFQDDKVIWNSQQIIGLDKKAIETEISKINF